MRRARTAEVTASRSIALAGDRLRLVAVADTHSSPHSGGLRHLAELSPDAILHAGDIGSLAVLDELAGIAPVFAVRGNIDAPTPGLPDRLTLDVVEAQQPVLRVLLLHIGVAGPRLRADAARAARAAKASLVVCGHSHVPFIGRDGAVTVFNPGSIGPRRFHLPVVFGVVDVTPAGVSLHHVDCETGRRWQP